MNGYSFGLQQLPFAAVPDTEAYFSTQQMETARQSIERTIRRGDGISLVVGSSGVGKTLLLRLLRKKLESEFTVASISNGKLSCPKDFLRQLTFELRLPVSTSSENDELQYRFALLEFARQEPTQGIVLLIDEAQYLDSSVLEEIRLLMNTDDGTKSLFRAVLAGTLEFEEKLTLAQLAPFDQRVAARIYLDTLTLDETIQYIDRQTAEVADTTVEDTSVAENGAASSSSAASNSAALKEYITLSGSTDEDNGTDSVVESITESENDSWGEVRRFDSPHYIQNNADSDNFGSSNSGSNNSADNSVIFTDEAKRLVYRYSEGLPRLVNQICRSAMEFAAEQIDERTIQTAWNSIQSIGSIQSIEIDGRAQETDEETAVQSDNGVIEEKKKPLELKQFDSVIEFGSLEDEWIQQKAEGIEQTVEGEEETTEIAEGSGQCYKPPYPMDFDEGAEEPVCEPVLTAETISLEKEFDLTLSSLFRKPVRKKKYRWYGPRKYQKRNLSGNKNESKPAAVAERFASLSLLGRDFSTETAWVGNVAGRSLFYPVRCGFIFSASSLDEANSGVENDGIEGVESTDGNTDAVNMDAETLKKYGEEILNDRPPFVRREPHYAYQTTDETPLASATLSDWNTPEKVESAGSATAYREFIERQAEETVSEAAAKTIDSGQQTADGGEIAETVSAEPQEENYTEVVRLVFEYSAVDEPVRSLSIDEDFDETVEVAHHPVAASVLFAAEKESSLALAPTVRETLGEYLITQQALEAVVQRITEAAEIIEQAADVSRDAGTQIADAADMSRESVIKFQETADWVQQEARAVLPNYKELFQELSEFQETVSLEMQRIKTDHRRFSETIRNVQPFMKEKNSSDSSSGVNETNQTLLFPKRSGFVPNSEFTANPTKKSAEFRRTE